MYIVGPEVGQRNEKFEQSRESEEFQCPYGWGCTELYPEDDTACDTFPAPSVNHAFVLLYKHQDVFLGQANLYFCTRAILMNGCGLWYHGNNREGSDEAKCRNQLLFLCCFYDGNADKQQPTTVAHETNIPVSCLQTSALLIIKYLLQAFLYFGLKQPASALATTNLTVSYLSLQCASQHHHHL
ncbi:hypothetical protein CBL_13951 [Carabus blaptoides fortunei]